MADNTGVNLVGQSQLHTNMTTVRRARLAGVLLLWTCLVAPLGAAPVNEEWADVNGTTLRYEWSVSDSLSAEAPVVVLLHEMGMALESWDYVIDSLRVSHRVLRYDLRGFGMSQKIRGGVTFEQESDDLEALLQLLDIKQPVALVGGAVGGATALYFAASHPERVRGVLAISPATGAAVDARPAVLAQADSLERIGMRALVERDLDEVYPRELRTSQALHKYRTLQYGTDPTSMAATWRMIAVMEWDEVLPRIECPTWLVATTLFRVRPPESVRALAEKVPLGKYAELETGHFAAVQSPELLQPLLDSFLGSLDPR